MRFIIIFSVVIIICSTVTPLHAQTWEQTNGPYGGDVYSLAINSLGDIFAAIFTGGAIYRSIDNGNNWTCINEGVMGARIFSLAIDSEDNIFVGTENSGVWISTDNGNSWSQIISGMGQETIWCLAINESDDIFTGGYSGIYRSINNGESWSYITSAVGNVRVRSLVTKSAGIIFAGTDGGLFRSNDNGDNWIAVNNGLTYTEVRSLAVNFSGDILAGTNDGGIYISTDDGENWTNYGLFTYTVFSIIFNSSGDIFAGTDEGVYRSTDNGDTWVVVDNDIIAVDLLVNPLGNIFAAAYPGVFRSIDNGENWTKNSNGIINTSIRPLVINSSDAIFSGVNQWGMVKSDDNGDSWQELDFGEYVRSFAVNSSNDIFAGTHHSGLYYSVNDGNTWEQVSNGSFLPEGRFEALAINQSDHIFAGVSGPGIFRSTDNGDNWINCIAGLTGVLSIAINPEGHIFAGGCDWGGVRPRIIRSTDNGDTWVDLGNGFAAEVMIVNSSGVIFASPDYHSDVQGIYKSLDNGDTWTQTDIRESGSNDIRGIEINNCGDIFVGLSDGGVYQSKDIGESWTQINDGLGSLFVTSLAINSTDDLFAGTATDGVFVLEGTSGINLESVSLISPSDGATYAEQIITLDWTDVLCADGYRLEYSSDPTFPLSSSQTISIDLPNYSVTDIVLPQQEAIIYWRIYTTLGDQESPPSPTGYFTYSPVITEEITSASIINPYDQAQIDKYSDIHAKLRMTSAYTGNFNGRWILDGSDWVDIDEVIIGNQGLIVYGPSFVSLEEGIHTLTAELDYPNSISSNTITFEILQIPGDEADHLEVIASPGAIVADGVQESQIFAYMLDANSNLAIADNDREVTFTLIGDGSLSSLSTTTADGVASVTYTAGTTPGSVIINGNALGVGDDDCTIILNTAELEVLLAQYDYLSVRFSNLELDMFWPLFNIPLLNNYDMYDANLFVDNQIRYVNPTPENLESFERLLLAEKCLHFGYRHKPSISPVIDFPNKIAGAQELWDAGTRNLAQALLAALGIYNLADGMLKSMETSGILKKFIKELGFRKLLNNLIKNSIKFVAGLAESVINLLPADEEFRNTIQVLIATLKTDITELLSSEITGELDLKALAISPVIRFGGDEIGLGVHVNTTEDDFQNAVNWAINNNYSGDLNTAENQIQTKIMIMKAYSETYMSDIQMHEYEFSSEDIFQSMQDCMDNFYNREFWESAKDYWDVIKGLLDVDRFYHAPQAAAVGFGGAFDIRDQVEEGIALAFGHLPASNIQTSVDDNTSMQVSSSDYSVIMEVIESSDGYSDDYINALIAVQNNMQTFDTLDLDSAIGNLVGASDELENTYDLLLAVADAAYDKAMASIPYFDSTYRELYKTVFKAREYQLGSMLYILGFAGEPNDTAYVLEGIAIIDTAIMYTTTSIESLVSVQQYLFLTEAKPLLQTKIQYDSEVMHPGRLDTAFIWMSNYGSGTATGNKLVISADSLIQLEPQDTIYIPDLNVGDSVSIEVYFSTIIPEETDFEILCGSISASMLSTNAFVKSSYASIFFETYICGDANYDGAGPNVADLVYMVDYLFKGGEPPTIITSGDVNNDGIILVNDLVYLVNYIFKGGPPPICN
ncbi:MAG: hypothetical protein ABIJ12_04340 [bacterium]